MSKELEGKKHPVLFSVTNSKNISINDAHVMGDMDFMKAVNTENISITNLKKCGAGRVFSGEDINGLYLRDLHVELPVQLAAELADDLTKQDRDSFFTKLQKFASRFPPERIQAIVELGEKVWKAAVG